MSLQINAHGTRDGILKHVAEVLGGKLPPQTDAAQAKAVGDLVTAELEQLPKELNGARVTVEAAAHSGARTIQLTIVPAKVHV